MNPFIETITTGDEAKRNLSFFRIAESHNLAGLVRLLNELDTFRRETGNLYHRVRACLFLYAGYRFFVQEHPELPPAGHLPYEGFTDLLSRRFEHAINAFIGAAKTNGLNGGLASGLAEAYHFLAFQYLSDQVRKSVRSSKGNQWLFRGGHLTEHPVRIHPRLQQKSPQKQLYPILVEQTPVRMDLSHSCWSDIFFLGMDYPEGARVINVSVDLGVFGRDEEIRPPITTYVRIIAEPLLRLTSLDLKATKDILDLDDLFNFGNDYLSLLKAGVIASGLIPPSFEGTGQSLPAILGKIAGNGMGIEVVTRVNDIPKGSRFAVSTNLLGSVISALMRATRQTASLEGELSETERRLVASRAILGEWLGGSGGGWQDSGGIWPGVKIIEGAMATADDPEYEISRGCLLPVHQVLTPPEIHPDIESLLANNLLLMHGGMAQNVGPVLEMVTEKYLLRSEREWEARLMAGNIFNEVIDSLREGSISRLADATSRNFHQPIKTIIPAATNAFTEKVIRDAQKMFGDDFLGFMMLGGMSGGGMGMFVRGDNPANNKVSLLEILCSARKEFATSLPFAMEPVVYNFAINQRGTYAHILTDNQALLGNEYYNLHISEMVKGEIDSIAITRREELDFFTSRANPSSEAYPFLRTMVSSLFRVGADTSVKGGTEDEHAREIKDKNGFDYIQHENLRKDMIRGRIGLSRNRLPAETLIEDVTAQDVQFWSDISSFEENGSMAIREGKAGILSLAGGVGSRWTQGAGVIKALNPFTNIGERHRSFLEIHLRKTSKVRQEHGGNIPHIIATSYLTEEPIRQALLRTSNFGYEGNTYLSAGKSIGQRFVPMERDLRFLWEETPQEMLDENKQKVQSAVREALISWARSKGEGSDYTDNLAGQRLNPLGHWYEVSNLLRNGTLGKVLKESPDLQTIMLHNIDTLGVDLDAGALGYHLESGNMLTFEVVPRRIEDRGGGLARVNGKLRLLEGLAQPREEDELSLSYYNSMTTWIQIDQLLGWFGLSRKDLLGEKAKIAAALEFDTILR